MSSPATDPAAIAKASPVICIDNEEHTVVEIRATGDILLDVSFENTNLCNKSIPAETIRLLRTSKSPIPSARVFYRVRLETLKKQSRYFAHLFGPNFAEGATITEAFGRLAKLGQDPTEVAADELPRIKIVDEDGATKTLGREAVFRDMLRIIHGAEHVTKPITTNTLAVLAVMADRYNTLPAITRYVQKTFASFKYPVTVDRNAEEVLRQKILIFFHTQQMIRFALATKELISRGSVRWTGVEDNNLIYQTAWWDLPHGLEAELAHRRALLLRTIASIQMQFLSLYSSRDRQCKLGYDSSSSCDSFQLGEMIKFLSKKSLLHLVPLQAVSPEDTDYIWPEAYTGDVDALIGILRQCPSYQIDKNHKHCGLRNKLLPALDYIKACIDSGLGVRLIILKSGDGSTHESWIPKESKNKKSFWVGNQDVGGDTQKTFEFSKARSGERWDADGSSGEIMKAKSLFTADKWNWLLEIGDEAVGWRRPTYGLGIPPKSTE